MLPNKPHPDSSGKRKVYPSGRRGCTTAVTQTPWSILSVPGAATGEELRIDHYLTARHRAPARNLDRGPRVERAPSLP